MKNLSFKDKKIEKLNLPKINDFRMLSALKPKEFIEKSETEPAPSISAFSSAVKNFQSRVNKFSMQR